jgi:hypothetical protein
MSARGLCGFALLLLTPERSTKPDTKIIVATALSIPPDLGRIITTDIVLPALMSHHQRLAGSLFAQPRRGSEKTRTQIQAVSERENEHQNSGSAETHKMFEYIDSRGREECAGYRACDCSHVSLTIVAAH